MEIKLTRRFLKKEAEHTCGKIQRATETMELGLVNEDWMKILQLPD